MDDEFALLRPVILMCAAALVLGVVIHACQQASEQRAELKASSLPSTNSARVSRSVKPAATCRTLLPESLPAAPVETFDP